MYCSLTHVFGNSSDSKWIIGAQATRGHFHLSLALKSCLSKLPQKTVDIVPNHKTYSSNNWFLEVKLFWHDYLVLYIKFSLNSFGKQKKQKNEKKKWNEIKIQEEVGGQNFHVKVLAINQYFTINNHCMPSTVWRTL